MTAPDPGRGCGLLIIGISALLVAIVAGLLIGIIIGGTP